MRWMGHAAGIRKIRIHTTLQPENLKESHGADRSSI
jgi:hypothetical protein